MKRQTYGPLYEQVAYEACLGAMNAQDRSFVARALARNWRAPARGQPREIRFRGAGFAQPAARRAAAHERAAARRGSGRFRLRLRPLWVRRAADVKDARSRSDCELDFLRPILEARTVTETFDISHHARDCRS